MSTSRLNTIITQEQLSKRVNEIARQISADYQGKVVDVICVLENGFLFMADLIRAIEVPVVCQFVKPFFRQILENNIATTEIFYSPEMEVEGRDVLIIEGVLQTGVTTEFLTRNFLTRGASSVKVAVLLDRQSQRRVQLQPDYFGFLVDERFLVGYGLPGPGLQDRNLPYIAVLKDAAAPEQEPTE
jgi:hypoxanthine phosphoribosyltransferase